MDRCMLLACPWLRRARGSGGAHTILSHLCMYSSLSEAAVYTSFLVLFCAVTWFCSWRLPGQLVAVHRYS